MATIAEELRLYERTGGNSSPDAYALIDQLLETRRPVVIKDGLYNGTQSRYTYDGIPATVDEAVKRYDRERQNCVDPFFINTLMNTREFNREQDRTSNEHPNPITEVSVTNYVTALYLAQEATCQVSPKKTQTRRIRVDKETGERISFLGSFFSERETKVVTKAIYPTPVVLITNPAVDGLPKILGKDLLTYLPGRNRGLRVINFGDPNSEDLKPLRQIPGYKQIDLQLTDPDNPHVPHFGIFTNLNALYGQFTDFPKHKRPLFGLENKVNAKLILDSRKANIENETITWTIIKQLSQ